MLRTFQLGRCFFPVFGLLLLASLCWAQKDTGNIVGTVTDNSGAVVPKASVTVQDVDRGSAFNTVTDSNGQYAAGPLKIGRYQVVVSKEGFKRTTVGPVELNLQERPSVDVTLQVGAIQEQVTVTTQGPQLET